MAPDNFVSAFYFDDATQVRSTVLIVCNLDDTTAAYVNNKRQLACAAPPVDAAEFMEERRRRGIKPRGKCRRHKQVNCTAPGC